MFVFEKHAQVIDFCIESTEQKHVWVFLQIWHSQSVILNVVSNA